MIKEITKVNKVSFKVTNMLPFLDEKNDYIIFKEIK